MSIMVDPDSSSVVGGVAWFCVALCGLALVTRSVSKARIIRHIGADDVFIWAGFLCFIGQCTAVQFQADNGLGRDIWEITPTTEDMEMKAEYANYLLYMPVIACAKLSVVSVLRKCALNKKDRLLLYTFEWFLAAWVVTSEFVRGFSCAMPSPWDTHLSCINRQAWVEYFELVNILSEVALMAMPTLSILRMPTSWGKKLFAISCFYARIVIIPASILRIAYWDRGSTSSNSTYELYPFAICTVLVAALEILAACVLYARPLFEILETGFSTSSPTSPTLPSNPKFGPYSRGTWPFTRVSTIDELLTSRRTGYEAHVQAAFYDEEKIPISVDDHIFVSRQVDVETSYPRSNRRDYLHSVRTPTLDNTWNVSDPTSFEKELPSPPSVHSGTFLIT